jgi:catechol 2,3-dioxygenase
MRDKKATQKGAVQPPNPPTPPGMEIGEVALVTASLPPAVTFYTQVLGLRLMDGDPSSGGAVLAAGNRRLILLREKPGAQPAPGATGLYHAAIRLPNRKSLAHLIYHLAEQEIEIQGAADHGVSESIYMEDPDGNGIELYCDRRKGAWPVDDLKRLQMYTDELDLDNLIMELKDGVTPWPGLPDGAIIGHIHLKASHLPEAEQFYTQIMGFELTQHQPGAAFVSSGGYHHLIGMNNWAGEGIPTPPADAAGLEWFAVRYPTPAALEALTGRLQAAGIAYTSQEGGLLVRDPSKNTVMVRNYVVPFGGRLGPVKTVHE